MLNEELRKLIQEKYPNDKRKLRLFFDYNDKFETYVKKWETITDIQLIFNILDFTVKENKEKDWNLWKKEDEFQRRITRNEVSKQWD